MKTYALSQGLNAAMSDEIKNAKEDDGVYTLGFDDILCTLSEESDAKGNPLAIAACHLAVIPNGYPPEVFTEAFNRITELGLFSIPVGSEEGALGLLCRLELSGISDEVFLDWMNDLERICRSAAHKEKDTIPVPEISAGNGYVRTMFEDAGISLDGDETTRFWRLHLPQGVAFLECDFSSGRSRLRSLVAERKPAVEELHFMTAFNLGLAGKGWLMCQTGLIWYCTQMPLLPVQPSDLTTLFSLHFENCGDIAACFTDQKEAQKPEPDDDLVHHLLNSVRI